MLNEYDLAAREIANLDYAGVVDYATSKLAEFYASPDGYADFHESRKTYCDTDCEDRVIPDGYTDQFDSTIWNVGHVFLFYNDDDGWSDCESTVLVKPGQSIIDAYAACNGDVMCDCYNVFFPCDD